MDRPLEQWLVVAARAAGVPESDVTRLDADLVAAILDLARDAAHGVERPAAPLAAFALGCRSGEPGRVTPTCRHAAPASPIAPLRGPSTRERHPVRHRRGRCANSGRGPPRTVRRGGARGRPRQPARRPRQGHDRRRRPDPARGGARRRGARPADRGRGPDSAGPRARRRGLRGPAGWRTGGRAGCGRELGEHRHPGGARDGPPFRDAGRRRPPPGDPGVDPGGRSGRGRRRCRPTPMAARGLAGRRAPAHAGVHRTARTGARCATSADTSRSRPRRCPTTPDASRPSGSTSTPSRSSRVPGDPGRSRRPGTDRTPPRTGLRAAAAGLDSASQR